MFDLTVIQLMNMACNRFGLVPDGFRPRDAIRPNIVRLMDSIVAADENQYTSFADIMDTELCGTSITEGEWMQIQDIRNAVKMCRHCGKEFVKSTSLNVDDFFTCSEECSDKWIPF